MKSQILGLLQEDYSWRGYDGISEELERRFGIKTTPKRVKEELKELYQIGLVYTEPCINSEGEFAGTGYFSFPRKNYASTVKINDL